MRPFLLMLISMIATGILVVPILIGGTIISIYKKKFLPDYFITVAIGFDQAMGSILYGQEDWTVSSWTYHLAVRKHNRHAVVFMALIDWLFGENHCKDSFINESKKQGEPI